MSKFLNEKYSALKPYTPGEQPKDKKYIKLNTNESPFPPSPLAIEYAAKELYELMLYPDPDVSLLTEMRANELGVSKDEVLLTNGSDEALNFAFMAYCSDKRPAIFPDITYGFYKVFADICAVPYTEIPLTDTMEIRIDDYIGRGGVTFIANPNAPTGILLPLSEIRRLIEGTDGMVVVDEAYVDFGGESAVSLIHEYDNLLVVGTVSKSRSMAGARLGYAAASSRIIEDLKKIKYSTNPYNVNRATAAAGVGALADKDYFRSNCEKIIKNREWCTSELRALGFCVLPSFANFVFAKSCAIGGEDLYLALKQKGILVRHFKNERIRDFVRITIGNEEQMHALVDKIKEILEK